jgi:1,4-dihydroxy-2-naphthoate octaprenyltransferase
VNYANTTSDGNRGTEADLGRSAAPRRLRYGVTRRRAARGVPGLRGGRVAGCAGRDDRLGLVVVGALCVLAVVLQPAARSPTLPGLGGSWSSCSSACRGGRTTYVQTQEWQAPLVRRGRHRAIACAIMVANNLRDIPTDRGAGKITLASGS